MRRYFRFYIVLLMALVTSGSVVWASETPTLEKFSTGKDWVENMSKTEKFISVFAPMIVFHRYGVNFRSNPEQYVDKIERVLAENPYLEKEDVANIFASTVYAYEPETRLAFHYMEQVFAYERQGYGPNLSPRLLIQKPRTREYLPGDSA